MMWSVIFIIFGVIGGFYWGEWWEAKKRKRANVLIFPWIVESVDYGYFEVNLNNDPVTLTHIPKEVTTH